MKLRLLCLMIAFYGCVGVPEKAEAQFEGEAYDCMSDVTMMSAGVFASVLACNPTYVWATAYACAAAVGATQMQTLDMVRSCSSYFGQANDYSYYWNPSIDPGFTQNGCTRVRMQKRTGKVYTAAQVCKYTTTYIYVPDPNGFCLQGG